MRTRINITFRDSLVIYNNTEYHNTCGVQDRDRNISYARDRELVHIDAVSPTFFLVGVKKSLSIIHLS
jgi:hypothetical protein